MMDLLVSIVMPIFNSQSYLKKSICSLIDQTYKNIEIILVDDGSTDKSLQICKKFQKKDSRIKIFHQKNKGVSSARNLGIKYSKGKYIIFIDSDDWIDKNYIQVGIKKLMKTNSDILLTPYFREYKNNSIKNLLFDEDKIFLKNIDLVHNKLLRKLFGPVDEELKQPTHIDDLSPIWGKFYKSEICKNISFVDLNKIGAEDIWFNINFFYRAKSAYYTNNIFYHYRKDNKNSLLHLNNSVVFNKRERLYTAMQNFITTYKLDSIYKEALQNRKIIDLIGITNNIFISKNNFQNKCLMEKKVLCKPIYKKEFKNFDYTFLPLKWVVFFKLCEKNKNYILGFLVIFGEKFKSVLK